MLRKFLLGAGGLILLLSLAIVVVYVVRHASVDTSNLLDRQTFRCYAVSESMRTIGYNRLKRKEKQLGRIDALLEKKLQELDDAKLRSERAILIQEIEEARFLRSCAEAYFEPGTTHLRETFPEPPLRFNADAVRKAFERANKEVPARMQPHGFDERAALHLADAAQLQGDHNAAIEIAGDHLKKHPDGLYADSLQLVMADALLQKGSTAEARELYDLVGKLPIGFDAHYARYRSAMILRSNGEVSASDDLLKEVHKWSSRGDREALERALLGENSPPAPR